MEKSKIVEQIKFGSLDDFIDKQNNFYAYFLDYCPWGKIRRERECFKRYQELKPEIERKLTRATVEAVKSAPAEMLVYDRLPYAQLFEAYKTMSQLVYVGDRGIKGNGELDRDFLIR